MSDLRKHCLLLVGKLLVTWKQFLNWSTWLLLAFQLIGCLASSHHLNTGRILKPGEYQNSYGLGLGPTGLCDISSKVKVDGYHTCILDSIRLNDSQFDVKPVDTTPVVWQNIPSFSTQWRLGMWEKWGPFTGVDMGYALEIPHTWEFDVRLGLPIPAWLKDSNATWQHNMALGWGLGFWSDNTWFVEYALGKRLTENLTLYINWRLNLLATQLADLGFDDNDIGADDEGVFKHHRRLLNQVNLGLEAAVPQKFFLLPDRWHLACHLGYPVLLLDGASVPDEGVEKIFDTKIILAAQWTYGFF